MKKKFSLILLLLALSSVALAQTAVIRSGSLKVYELPDTGSNIVTKLSAGDTVRVIEQQGNWAKLQLPGKSMGWLPLTRSIATVLTKKPRQSQGAVAPQPSLPSATDSITNTEDAGRCDALQSRRATPAADLNLGISFTLGAVGENFAYSGRFLYRSLPSFYLEGSFQHVPGDVAASLLLHSNLLYDFSLSREAGWNGWLTAGIGVISTSPTKTVGAKSVSNMEINYGIGVRRYLKHRTYLRADLRRFSVLLDNGTKNYVEFALGIIIGIR